MAKLNKAARGKHRWIGFLTFKGEMSRADCEIILSEILPSVKWKLFDFKKIEGVYTGIIKVPLESYEVSIQLINEDQLLETLTSSGKINLVRQRLGLK
ncbi:TPA: hypothetical protein HA324_01130 [Candidatus Thalassarchaeaceae archaeon]|jgi:hypothetical protein|nr:hypothetical protein [Euryarchaeota archaeon]MDG1547922.1 hypothetical protein [Candidatus Thalassarchaeaceae archaeon]DAC62867.1 MAG TPA: hypothetical protein D7I02_03170 [Candidatus Poseidoniales archaeon]MBT3846993.1 hypothetical protein [Euryarchaeota archaeon]MBT4156162.1 hypothetical protein [Euryarchaeota archaeon]|tara:strand:- start:1658 stop:1951 length:294 start_codon:yes stop_codon:yes gene_type:complete